MINFIPICNPCCFLD